MALTQEEYSGKKELIVLIGHVLATKENFAKYKTNIECNNSEWMEMGQQNESVRESEATIDFISLLFVWILFRSFSSIIHFIYKVISDYLYCLEMSDWLSEINPKIVHQQNSQKQEAESLDKEHSTKHPYIKSAHQVTNPAI